jgi:protocatechuate 3,4-dioxygenase, alpha subunit
MADLTPFQTVGPFFSIALCEPGAAKLATAATAGRRITLEGTVRDGAGAAVPDALLEIWQANANGRYDHPDDDQELPLDPSFSGYGRAPTDADGHFVIETIMPGRVPGPDDTLQAPHLLVGILARGILTRLVTRIYFEDEPSTATDPILQLVPDARRATLIARREGQRYRFDIRLQGEGETVFFDV